VLELDSMLRSLPASDLERLTDQCVVIGHCPSAAYLRNVFQSVNVHTEDFIARNSRLSELYNSGKLDAGIIIRLSRFPRDASEQLRVR
jgi:hypothetical protein